ncbi:unnamed protein product [Closterium sp. NIES-64]|nr:unnamed protein product [Closterium sp. NIES-64]
MTYAESRGHNFVLNATFDEGALRRVRRAGGAGRAPRPSTCPWTAASRRSCATSTPPRKPIASICHGQLVLAAADVLKGSKCTAYPAVKPVVELAGGQWVDADPISACLFDDQLRPGGHGHGGLWPWGHGHGGHGHGGRGAWRHNLITGAAWPGHPEFLSLLPAGAGRQGARQRQARAHARRGELPGVSCQGGGGCCSCSAVCDAATLLHACALRLEGSNVEDFMEDYEAMVPMQALQALGYRVGRRPVPERRTGDVCKTAVHDFEGDQTYTEKPGHNFALTADFENVRVDDYDALLVPGGRAPEYLALNARVLEVVRQFHAARKPIASVCHGQQILAAAGVLKVRHAVHAYPAVKPTVVLAGGEWQEPDPISRCFQDGHLITGAAWPAHPELISLLMAALGTTVTA